MQYAYGWPAKAGLSLKALVKCGAFFLGYLRDLNSCGSRGSIYTKHQYNILLRSAFRANQWYRDKSICLLRLLASPNNNYKK